MEKPKRKQALTIAFIAAGALLFFLVVAVASTIMSDAIGQLLASTSLQPNYAEPAAIHFNHEVHNLAGLECTTCHQQGKADSPADLKATCALCHRPGETTASIPDSLLPIQPSALGVFEHGVHTQKIACKSCHEPDTAGKSVSNHQQVNCTNCHKGKNP
jgi:hypothetical protein